EASVLLAGFILKAADLRYVESAFWRRRAATQCQRIASAGGNAAGDDIPVDRKARTQFQSIGAVEEFNRIGLTGTRRNRAAIDNKDVAGADKANSTGTCYGADATIAASDLTDVVDRGIRAGNACAARAASTCGQVGACGAAVAAVAAVD